MPQLNPLHKIIFVSTYMNKLLLILSLCCLALCASAREYADTALYQGMSIKATDREFNNNRFTLANAKQENRRCKEFYVTYVKE